MSERFQFFLPFCLSPPHPLIWGLPTYTTFFFPPPEFPTQFAPGLAAYVEGAVGAGVFSILLQLTHNLHISHNKLYYKPE